MISKLEYIENKYPNILTYDGRISVAECVNNLKICELLKNNVEDLKLIGLSEFGEDFKNWIIVPESHFIRYIRKKKLNELFNK